MASKYTKYDLQHITDYLGFESFCHDLMSRIGYKDIEPLGGYKDKGRDAIYESEMDNQTTIFSYSVREDWAKKLFEDINKIVQHGHLCQKLIYVTTSDIGSAKKDELKQRVKDNFEFELILYDLERIGTLVDNQFPDLKQLHSNIFQVSLQFLENSIPQPDTRATNFKAYTKELNPQLYAQYCLNAYHEWLERYTPLLANHRTIEPYAIPTSNTKANREIPVAQVPNLAPICILLGESGAGKTTALWRIIVEFSQTLQENKTTTIPILIGLRSWEPQFLCRDLVQAEFAGIEVSQASVEMQLLAGNCLILIDGLNELPPNQDLRRAAYKDIQRFLTKYPKNRFVICCRHSDYDATLLDIEQLKKKLPTPSIFEIKRLDRDQIADYVHKYFKHAPEIGNRLLLELDITNDDLWKNASSVIHLARIPLYLQLMITEFEVSGQLASTQAKLLKTLVLRAIDRERNTSQVDRFGKERLLASFAYKAHREGYSLTVPEYMVRSIFVTEIKNLKEFGFIHNELTFGTIWQEIFSNNFLKAVDFQWIEWLHQLILDYFLACEIVRIRVDNNSAENITLNAQLKMHNWEQPCSIALGLFDPVKGGEFIEKLMTLDSRVAEKAFINQTDEDAEKISKAIINEIVESTEPDAERLCKFVIHLPYKSIVETLFEHFRASGKSNIRVQITQAVTSIVIAHYSSAYSEGTSEATMSQSEIRLRDRRESGVKRALQILSTWIANSDEFVCFYAAKGLWEYDKGRAAETLKALSRSKNKEVLALIQDLRSTWGIV